MILGIPDLLKLFAKHCRCRPLDVKKSLADHGSACDTAILADVQVLLRHDASPDERYAAVKRCDRYSEGDYATSETVH